jgi:hypothetical protein
MPRIAMNNLCRNHGLRVLVLFGLLAIGRSALAQSDPLPERIVTNYALTSTHDYSYYDPRPIFYSKRPKTVGLPRESRSRTSKCSAKL